MIFAGDEVLGPQKRRGGLLHGPLDHLDHRWSQGEVTGGKAAKRKGCGREFGGTCHGGLNDLNELEWGNPQK